MRRFAAGRAAHHRERVAMLRRTTHGPQRCDWPGGCAHEAVDAHEMLSRARGGSITDPANILLLCREHHDWIGAHPAEAATLGLALSDTAAKMISVSDKPEPGTVRLSVRISGPGKVTIERFMADTGATRSTVVRAMLKVASAHELDVIVVVRHLTGDR